MKPGVPGARTSRRNTTNPKLMGEYFRGLASVAFPLCNSVSSVVQDSDFDPGEIKTFKHRGHRVTQYKTNRKTYLYAGLEIRNKIPAINAATPPSNHSMRQY